LKERLFVVLCIIGTVFGVLALVTLFYQVFVDGWHRLSWDFLTSMPSRHAERAGVLPALVGTLWLLVLTTFVTVPLGIGSAVYLEEFAPKNRLSKLIQINIANLAGVPSIVYGLLGLAIFVRTLSLERSLAAAALTMSLLILPMVITASQEAIRAVPNSFREGSLALGATRWETVRNAVLPSAYSGILTGVILGLSRALGEAAPLIAIGAATFVSTVPKSPMEEGFTVLPIQIFNWADRPKREFLENSAAAIIVLMTVILAFNLLAAVLRSKARKRTRS
jgi:phosphate transport system permease protein